MVFIKDKKFACESCIKGHRSTSCQHTERPLFEIKKKGRPVSQCEQCRQLRQSKRVHSKCTCNEADCIPQPSTSAPPAQRKLRRFVPITPALPNGLKDVTFNQMSISHSADSRQAVESLLNLCNCSNPWACSCHQSEEVFGTDDLAVADVQTRPSNNGGLAALAHAAASVYQDGSSPECKTAIDANISTSAPQGQRLPSRPSPLSGEAPKHPASSTSQVSSRKQAQLLELPPILFPSPLDRTPAAFPKMPSISSLQSIAGTGCTCGFQCSCPGCVEHRGSTHASKQHSDCTQACGHCVDHTSGSDLSHLCSTLGHGVRKNSIVDEFFARASSLPSPPTHRMLGVHLDRNNVHALVGNAYTVPAGPVNLPKLHCCDGRCKCPEGRCRCGTVGVRSCIDDPGARSQAADGRAFNKMCCS